MSMLISILQVAWWGGVRNGYSRDDLRKMRHKKWLIVYEGEAVREEALLGHSKARWQARRRHGRWRSRLDCSATQVTTSDGSRDDAEFAPTKKGSSIVCLYLSRLSSPCNTWEVSHYVVLDLVSSLTCLAWRATSQMYPSPLGRETLTTPSWFLKCRDTSAFRLGS